jgi:hypothetical protein
LTLQRFVSAKQEAGTAASRKSNNKNDLGIGTSHAHVIGVTLHL